MPYYSRNVALAAELETTIGTGINGVITIGAATAGVLPVGAATVTTPGTGYSASTTLNVRFMDANGIASAVGTITTNASGNIASAAVTSGGGGYVNGAPAQFTLLGIDNYYGGNMNLPTGAINGRRGVLIGTDFSIKITTNMIERDLLRGFMGGRELIPGDSWAELTFTTELAPSGTLGVTPAWDKLIKAAGFAEVYTITGGAIVKIDYTPISDLFPSLNLQARFGGIRAEVRGARVSKMELDLTVSTLPTCKWTVVGLLKQVATNGFNIPDLSAWATPAGILDGNTADIRFGGTLNTATGVVSSGTAYPSQGLKLVVDNNAKFRPFLGGNAVPITQRETTGEITADLTDVQRLDWFNKYQANTLESLYFGLGLSAGKYLRVWTPNCERQQPDNVDDDGLFLTHQPIRCRPTSVNGNDEIRFMLM